jgi:DNA repair protein RecN (Recombination protein N)
VLCVTHLAPVAACATSQFRVSKALRDGVATSRVEGLDTAQRVDELARMIGGIHITETTLAHAQELLETFGRALDRDRTTLVRQHSTPS